MTHANGVGPIRRKRRATGQGARPFLDERESSTANVLIAPRDFKRQEKQASGQQEKPDRAEPNRSGIESRRRQKAAGDDEYQSTKLFDEKNGLFACVCRHSVLSSSGRMPGDSVARRDAIIARRRDADRRYRLSRRWRSNRDPNSQSGAAAACPAGIKIVSCGIRAE
jgi:hypothetical protein